MTFQYDSPASEMLADAIAAALGIDRAQIDAYCAAQRERNRRNFERHARRWAAAIDAFTDVQLALITKMEQEGFAVNKLWTYQGRTAVMMVKRQVWDASKGRMGTRLTMVYPDGSRVTTMERTITVRRTF